MHPYLKRLSHSSISLLHSCPRKYELYKLSYRPAVVEEDNWQLTDTLETVTPALKKEGDVHTDFGSLVGDATQFFFINGDMQATLWRMFCQWKRPLEDESNRNEKKKSFYHAIHAVKQFADFRNTAFAQWDIAVFNGVPACELGYLIDCGDGFYTRGFLDGVLVNKLTGEYAVYEGKTTGARYLHEAMYRNSGQGLGYDLVLETLTGRKQNSIPVFYSVYMSGSQEWNLLPFPKTRLGRANWIRDLLITKQHVSEYAENAHFPMHGESCYSYNRECNYFGTCEFSNTVLGIEDVEATQEDLSAYTLRYNLEEIINAQLAELV